MIYEFIIGFTTLATLERSMTTLGQAADRVYRAMFVYSQGLHAVLQEAQLQRTSTSLEGMNTAMENFSINYPFGFV